MQEFCDGGSLLSAITHRERLWPSAGPTPAATAAAAAAPTAAAAAAAAASPTAGVAAAAAAAAAPTAAAATPTSGGGPPTLAHLGNLLCLATNIACGMLHL